MGCKPGVLSAFFSGALAAFAVTSPFRAFWKG
jgi:hypothetical protein